VSKIISDGRPMVLHTLKDILFMGGIRVITVKANASLGQMSQEAPNPLETPIRSRRYRKGHFRESAFRFREKSSAAAEFLRALVEPPTGIAEVRKNDEYYGLSFC
jgi:hypothetical protein